MGFFRRLNSRDIAIQVNTNLLCSVKSINVKIEGVIDLGSNWKQLYRTISPLRSNINVSENAKHDIDSTKHIIDYTKGLEYTVENKEAKSYKIYETSREIQSDARITNFTNHVYKQSLKFFETLKENSNDAQVSKMIDLLMKYYINKFEEFIKDTRKQKIKTRLGTQKVILNTIDTSYRVVQRLINYLAKNEEFGSNNLLQKEIVKERQLELMHACQKFNACNTYDSFSDFLVEAITEVIQNNDRNIKQLADAATEVMKGNDFNKVVEPSAQEHLDGAIEKIEMAQPNMIRQMLIILKNVLVNRNRPISITEDTKGNAVNNTVKFLNFIDSFDKQWVSGDENQTGLNTFMNSLKQWRQGKKSDLVKILDAFMGHIKTKALNIINADATLNIRNQINSMLK